MNIKNTLLLLLLLTVQATPAWAQDWQEIKNNPEYLWGEGTGSTLNEADQNALADLTSKITVQVTSGFEIVEEETSDGQKVDSKTYVANRMKTYSQATLNNTERIVVQNEPKAIVGRYIACSEVGRLFAGRLFKAQDLAQSAMKSEAAGKVDDALRCYYWSLALTRSLQHPNEAHFKDEDEQDHLLITWLPERMNAIFGDIAVSMEGRDGDNIEIGINYKGKPVSSIDYTYFDGRDWCAITSGKDGHGLMEMAPGFAGQNLQLRIEYEYLGEAHIEREMEAVLGTVRSIPMRKAIVNVPVKKNLKAVDKSSRKAASTQSLIRDSKHSFARSDASTAIAPKPLANDKEYIATVNKVLAAIRSRQYQTASDCFTAEGGDMFQKLIHYGSAKIVGTPQPVFYESEDGVVCRGLQMSFAFQHGVRKSFVEDVVLTLDREARIKNISFGLGQTAEQDILCKGVWNENVRIAIMQFLENYKTAYALKRLDYIKAIFDDDAVIIVGSVAQRTNATTYSLDTDSKRFGRKEIKYTRYSKEQYIKNLQRCFASQEFVNIRFANNDVRKMGTGGELYAIQIAQDYYSSTYGDKGYLFLMVDLNDAEHPLIKVRTWQPEKDPKFGLYGPGDFK